MAAAVWVVVVAIMISVGTLVANYRGITSAWKASTERWWQRGPLRRRFNVKNPSYRTLGALLILVGVILLYDIR
jgi:hypothetical protein